MVLSGLGPSLGMELFPQVDSGEFVVRFRALPGSNFEITREIWQKSLQVIQEEAAGRTMWRFRWASPGSSRRVFSMNNLILFMRGPDDGQMRVALRDGSGVHLQSFRERLRRCCRRRSNPGWRTMLQGRA